MQAHVPRITAANAPNVCGGVRFLKPAPKYKMGNGLLKVRGTDCKPVKKSGAIPALPSKKIWN